MPLDQQHMHPPATVHPTMQTPLLELTTTLQTGGGLWHTTHPDRYRRILETGALLPEPDIPENERWKTAAGPESHPFVRKLGGVSLFDFGLGFDRESYRRDYPLSSVVTFVPIQQGWGEAVWIEIDRAAVAGNLLSPGEVMLRWKDGGHYRHTFMPMIEAAHLGPLPRSAFRRALRASRSPETVIDVGT